MSQIHIVTDSSAQFTKAHFPRQQPITILPNTLVLGGKAYREGVDIGAEEAIQRIGSQTTPPIIQPPSVEDYAATYAHLARTHDFILSIHASKAIFRNWHNAQAAASHMDNVLVVDTQMVCAAQGMLVQLAVAGIAAGKSADDIVREVRGAVDRLYAAFYVEKPDYLVHYDILSPSHSVLGMMLGVKPLLAMEKGLLTPIEKVKTRAQALDRMVEFAMEFTDIEEIVLLQHKPGMTEQTRLLQEHLMPTFPDHPFQPMMYSPSLAAVIGANASGIVIFEQEIDDYDI